MNCEDIIYMKKSFTIIKIIQGGNISQPALQGGGLPGTQAIEKSQEQYRSVFLANIDVISSEKHEQTKSSNIEKELYTETKWDLFQEWNMGFTYKNQYNTPY